MIRSSLIALLLITGFVSCKKEDCHRDHTPQNLEKFTTRSSGTTETLTDIHFADAANGMVVGTYGFVSTTADGGKTWTRLYQPAMQSMLSAFMLDKNNLFIARNVLLGSGNAGNAFLNLSSMLDDYNAIRSIHFFDNDGGIIVKGNSVYYTTDRGAHWTARSFSPGYLARLQVVSGNVWYAWGGISYDDVSAGEMYRTTDGGVTWTALFNNAEQQVLAAHFTDARNGYYASFSHAILGTHDGGTTWETVLPYFEDYITDLAFLSQQEGYLTTSNGKAYGTTDGGKTWAVLYETPSGALNRIIITPDKKVWIAGDNGILLTR